MELQTGKIDTRDSQSTKTLLEKSGGCAGTCISGTTQTRRNRSKLNENKDKLISEKNEERISTKASKRSKRNGKRNKIKPGKEVENISKKSEGGEPVTENESRKPLAACRSRKRGSANTGKPSGTVQRTVSEKSKITDKSAPKTDKEKSSHKEKMKIKLRPSDIRYSQGSISSQFKDGTNIGQLLDDIVFGRCFVSAIPLIEVSQIKGQWVSGDNRRLWVFKQLEKLGRTDLITVKVSKKIYCGKLTSGNKGLDVDIRNGEPTGIAYSFLQIVEADQCSNENGDSEKVAEKKRKRRRRRGRRRKARLNGSDDQTDGSNHDFDTSHQLDRLSTDSDAGQDSSESDIETHVQNKQTLIDEIEKVELINSETDDWEYDDSLSDAALSEVGSFSDGESLAGWLNYDSESDLDDDTNITTSVFTPETAQSPIDSVDFAYIDASKYRYPMSNVKHPQVELEDDQLKFSEQQSKTTTFGQYRSSKMANTNVSEIHGHHFGFSFSNRVEDEYAYYTPIFHHSGTCGNLDCLRCARTIFYSDLDFGPYYEPPCNRSRVRYGARENDHVPVEIITKSSNNPPEKSFLSKVSNGIDIVAGILQKIFA